MAIVGVSELTEVIIVLEIPISLISSLLSSFFSSSFLLFPFFFPLFSVPSFRSFCVFFLCGEMDEALSSLISHQEAPKKTCSNVINVRGRKVSSSRRSRGRRGDGFDSKKCPTITARKPVTASFCSSWHNFWRHRSSSLVPQQCCKKSSRLMVFWATAQTGWAAPRLPASVILPPDFQGCPRAS